MSKPLRIGIDLDGVGYIFGASVTDYLDSIGVTREPATDNFCTSWDFFKRWAMSDQEFSKHCDDGVDDGFIFGPGSHLTRPNFFESIRIIKEMGHKVIIVTHRYQGSPGNAELNTYKWLHPIMDIIDEIHFSHDKTSVPTDMFVEDNLNNYDALIAAGTDAYLINRPWNMPYNDKRNRINDIADYADAVVARTLLTDVV